MKHYSKEECISEVFTKFLIDMSPDRLEDKKFDIVRSEAEALVKGYKSPTRHYHTIGHAYDCYLKAQSAEENFDTPKAVLFSTWYHDIEYVVGRSDNEIISGLNAKRVLESLGCTESFKEKVFELIISTIYSKKDRIPDDKLTNDQKYLRDIDFSVMGTEQWDKFCAYEKGIRKEYESVVSPSEYVIGRIEFFKGVIQKPLIFYTEFFQDQCEVQARRNIQKALKKLEASLVAPIM